MKFKKVIQNNWFMLKLLHSVCPSKIYLSILMTIWGCVLTIITNVVLVRTVIDKISEGKSFIEILIFMIGIFAFQITTSLVTSIYNSFYLPKANLEIERKLSKKFYQKVVEIDLEDIETAAFYDEFVRAGSMLSGKANDVLNTICNVISTIVMLSSMSVILIMIDPFLILFAVAPFLYTVFIGNKINKINLKYYMEDTILNRKIDYVNRLFYLTDYAKELRLTNIMKLVKRNYTELMGEKRRRGKKRFPVLTSLDYIGTFIEKYIVGRGSMFYAAYRLIVSKTMVLGDFFVVTNSIWSISGPLQSVASIVQNFNNNALYIDQVKMFLEREPKLSRNETGPIAEKNNINLKLRSVNFKYNGAKEDCLKNINMEIKSGEKIAFVGNNGAGKTTMVKLLMRLYDVDSGCIELNGQNIKEYNLDSYRDLFGTIFQDHKVFSLTVKENVFMSDEEPENSNEILEQSLIASDISEKFKNMPLKYDTVLSREFDEHGTILSGGEYQKVALSRVFAKNSGIVILDEPSSALDPIAEYKMYKNMMDVCKDKTVIFISHRLSSAVMADKIFLFDNGRIIESGTHKELIALNKKYADMFNKQAEKYKAKEPVAV